MTDHCPAPTPVAPTDWTTANRVDVTYSQPESDAQLVVDRHVRAAIEACEVGATITHGLGVWKGTTEAATIISMVAPRDTAVRAIVGTAIAAGCTAVQVESWQGAPGPRTTSYECREWRAS